MRTGTIIAAAVAVLGALSCLTVFSSSGEGDENIAEEISVIRNEITLYDNKKMYDEAVQKYKELINLNGGNYELIIEYRDYCKLHDYAADYGDACYKALSLKPDDFDSAKGYLEYLEESSGGLSKRYKFLHNEINAFEGEQRQYFSDYYDNIKGRYNVLSGKYENIGGWHNNYIFCPDENGNAHWLSGKETYAFAKDENGNDIVIGADGSAAFVSDEIIAYSMNENLVSAYDEEQLVYINTQNRRKIVPYDAGKSELLYYDYLGAYSNGLANFSSDGGWGYIDKNANVISDDYEYATAFMNGIAAVKSEGKWKFVKIDSEKGIVPLSEETYDDVYLDEYGYPFSYGFAYVKKSGASGWSLIRVNMNEEMNSINGTVNVTDLVFDDVKPFGAYYGAVSKDGKWGFISTDGTWLIEPEYEDAKSFGCGLAPVMKDGTWGYVDKTKKLIIEYKFDNADTFNTNGIAAVKIGNQCEFIQLLEYADKD